MSIRTFTANSLPDALAKVREHIGDNAVILHTRSYRAGGILGFFTRTVVEVTAGNGREVGQARTRKQREAMRSAAASAARRRRPAEPEEPAIPASTPAGDLIKRTYAAAQARLQQQGETDPNAATEEVLNRLLADAPTQRRASSPSSHAHPQTPGKLSPKPDPTPHSPRSEDDADRTPPAAPSRDASPAPSPAAEPVTNAASVAVVDHEMAEELRFVRQMVGKLMRNQSSGEKAGTVDLLPEPFADQYLNLINQGVDDRIADRLVNDARKALAKDDDPDEQQIRDALRDQLAAGFEIEQTVTNKRAHAKRQPYTIALIGPTGVGKTTTIAKLAAIYKLKHKKKVGLITLDTFRIAAVEQLQTYAQIIDVPLNVVSNPEQIDSAFDEFADCDVVLVDTAGRSQRDDPKLDQLKRFIEVSNPHEVHLVLSATSSEPVLNEIVRRFTQVRTDRLIFTKLDEAVSFGVMLNVAASAGRGLSYITTGQEVPHQIEASKPRRLAQIILDGSI